MKKNELIKIIELVVRKEVKKQVNEIFINDNKTSLTELVSAPKDEKKFKEPIREQYKTKPMKEVHYTDNQELNRVLNETAGGVPNGEGGYDTMGGGVYDTSKMGELLGYGNIGGIDGKCSVLSQQIGINQVVRSSSINSNSKEEGSMKDKREGIFHVRGRRQLVAADSDGPF